MIHKKTRNKLVEIFEESKKNLDDLEQNMISEIDKQIGNEETNLNGCNCPYEKFCYSVASYCPLNGKPIHGTPKGHKEFNFSIIAELLMNEKLEVKIPERK